ncbi:alginate export family protein [Nitrospira japonica]|nr:alginate export family protein [Nitrospira japonica]
MSDGSPVRLPQSQFHLDQALHVPDWLHLSVDFRTRYESYSQPVKKNETTGGAQFSERTDVNMEMRYKPFKFHAEFLDARPLYNYGVIVSGNMENRNDMLQLYGSLWSDNFLGSGQPTELQIGKFTQAFGKSRLIARSFYSNVPYSFVGAHWSWGKATDWQVRAFAMRPVKNQQTSPDTLDSHTNFFGLSYLNQRRPWLHTELYTFTLTQTAEGQGINGRSQEQITTGRRPHLTTMGFRLFQPEAAGAFDYEIESAYQFGQSALQPGGPPLTTFSFFQHGEFGYTFNVRWKPAIRLEYDYASGDKNPNDNQNGRFDPLFGTYGFSFTPTGIWGLFKRSNINSPGYVLSVQPVNNLRASFKQRFWFLAQAKDEFQGADLQDQTGQAGTSLGSDLDTRLAWTAGPNLIVEGGWLYLIKGSYYSNLLSQGVAGSPNDKNASYMFLSVRLIF